MDAAKEQVQPEYGEEQADAGRECRTRRETKFSGANGDREKCLFPVQLTTSRIGNLTRLILTLAMCVCVCVCVCVFFPFILDFNGRTSRGHTGRR